MLLVDTSVWVEIFRKPQRLPTAPVFDLDEVVTCLPVIQEVLQGFKDQRAFTIARESMLSLPRVESPMGVDLFLEGAELYRAARRAGFSIRSGVDCVIAACGIRHGLIVVHHDRDFDLLAQVSTLQSQPILLAT